MKNYSKLGLATLLLVMAFACKQATASDEASSEMTTDSKAVISSNAAVEKSDSNRRFIRTADIKFKVKNVAKSTYAIENSVAKFGGFVTYSDLKSTITSQLETKISQDSVLETTKFIVDNKIIFRVANTQLDTVLKSLVKEVAFLDNRLIKADDVALGLMANKLAQNRSSNHEARLEKAIDNKGKKLGDINKAEDNLLEKQSQNDAARLQNLSLEDQVSFSTVTLYLYQRETTTHEMLINEKSVYSYRPNIGLQIIESLKTGWYLLETIIAFVTQLWALILLGILGYLGFKKYTKK